ncbi:hypothetical protein APTSU1_001226600 [Apodemus speciosus]|uniref:Uncharacterized protein n=1 Tax=Apodemus speciosus TaxID=105296 RepID=A0ABQ0FCP9_APOSI
MKKKSIQVEGEEEMVEVSAGEEEDGGVAGEDAGEEQEGVPT